MAPAAMRGVSFAALALALFHAAPAPAQEDTQTPEELRPSSELPPPDSGAVFDAPNMPGVRMMAPIPDGSTTLAAPPPSRAASQPASATPAKAATQHANLVQAFAAARRADWGKARAYAGYLNNRVAGLVVEWRFLLDENSGASFEAINAFLTQHPDWPRRDALLARAEKTMPDFLDPKVVIAWYGDRAPVTGIGTIRLAEAMMAAGKRDDGVNLVRKAWSEGSFSLTDERQILDTHGDLLRDADHRARLEFLLARDDVAAAKRQASRVDGQSQRLAEARIRLKASPAAVKTVIAGLPDSLRDNPAILFEEARALRRRGQDEDAWAAMLRAPLDKDATALAGRWWTERNIMTRDALKAGNMSIAYDLVSQHALDSGSGFADAEFLAGWISLRFLNKPDIAAGHFRALSQAVNLPISKARAYYWLGRAEEAAKRPADALADYRRASDYSETYYGQLALARIDDKPVLRLRASSPDATRDARDTFEADERVLAIRLFAETNERDMTRLFAIRMANDAPADPRKLQLLSELMLSLGDRAMSVRVAKLASYNDVVLPPYLAPVVDIPNMPRGADRPEPALVLGLARQESEFDPNVVSSAGARGLMQLMPATAKRAASTLKLGYRQGDLTAKPQYNMQLGMATISDYLAQWDGSYVLAIASYNAGIGNVRKWVAAFGDPRDSTIDPVDWIELIPFSETRNYVQRVIENIEVYRNRLTGRDQRLAILTDVYGSNTSKAPVLKFDPPRPTEAPRPAPAGGQASAAP